MDTIVCFVFLLAIGLSAQRSIHSVTSEFQIEFYELVREGELQNGGKLLNCPEDCDEVKEKECQCVQFDHCMNSTVFTCISTGLHRLNFPSSILEEFLNRLTELPGLHTTPANPHQWHTPVSPRRFLNYILEQDEKINAQRG